MHQSLERVVLEESTVGIVNHGLDGVQNLQSQQPSRYASTADNPERTGGASAAKAAVICSPPSSRFSRLSRDKAPSERQRPYGLGHETLSASLQDGIRFFHIPTPYLQRLALRFACPKGRRHSFLVFVVSNLVNHLGPTRTPVTQYLRGGKLEPPDLATHRLVQACQHHWLVATDDAAVVCIC